MSQTMRAFVSAAMLASAIAGGCTGNDRTDEAPAEKNLTQHQRDSILGASKLPGAGAVQRALNVADSASARTAPLDSLMR